MIINCDWEKCVPDCKHYYICNLRTPTNKRLTEIRKEMIWIRNRVIEINKGIMHLYSLEKENVPASLLRYLSKKDIAFEVSKLKKEKEELLQKLREYQIKEKNMNKLLKRRYNEI